ncbi:DUF3658 domain-containing protein [Bradyrhizobium sp. Leo121]|uniref:DUF3658 domain-containing protein n=1 Tax=Bradyrhizobium sp. Leo121 TaxID=1571195 RepID=UPI001029A7A2|nr:DUF3658 domain-containing protein [Bradyrhizobium sp. Leo121]
MNRKQAVRINEHLLDAYQAMDDARMAIAGLGKDERLKLEDLLQEVVAALQQKLLAPIYDQYPDLEPPVVDEEIPTVDSRLEWSQVRLPPSLTEADFDSIIFSLLKPQWQKTARMIILVEGRCQELSVPISHAAIAARLKVLADSNRIEGVGDIRMWRYSEVRLKD